MTSRELKRLNHYPEFSTDAGINSIISFIANGVLPAGFNARQTARYNQKFGAGSGFVVRNQNQDLFYNPNPNINLEVVRPNQIQGRIQQVYNDVQRGLGNGLGAFYHQIAMTFLNITKAETDDFLRSQGDYLVGRVPVKTINRPITSRVPNERWGVDLINMENYPPIGNQNRRFIMTVIDYFSGKIFARSISNNQNNNAHPTLSNAMNDICVNEAFTFPHMIQGDGEFAVGNFRFWCQNSHIQFVRTSSHTPISNGKVERANREIRKKIKAGIIRNNNLIWNPHLQDYIQNINNQQNSRNGLTPNQLWTQGYNPHPNNHQIPQLQPLNDNMNPQQIQNYQEAFIDNRARHLVSLGRPPPVFQVGNLVRIKLLVIVPRLRQIRETGLGWNKVAVHYTPEVYQVVQAFHFPPNAPRNDEYILSNFAGQILMAGVVPKRFFGNELIRVPLNHINTHILPPTIQRAMLMNRIQ